MAFIDLFQVHAHLNVLSATKLSLEAQTWTSTLESTRADGRTLVTIVTKCSRHEETSYDTQWFTPGKSRMPASSVRSPSIARTNCLAMRGYIWLTALLCVPNVPRVFSARRNLPSIAGFITSNRSVVFIYCCFGFSSYHKWGIMNSEIFFWVHEFLIIVTIILLTSYSLITFCKKLSKYINFI